MKDKYVCEYCGEICAGNDALEARSPFDESDILTGCPNCKSINTLLKACDVDGCSFQSSKGEQTEHAGYVFTCRRHKSGDVASRDH